MAYESNLLISIEYTLSTGLEANDYNVFFVAFNLLCILIPGLGMQCYLLCGIVMYFSFSAHATGIFRTGLRAVKLLVFRKRLLGSTVRQSENSCQWASDVCGESPGQIRTLREIVIFCSEAAFTPILRHTLIKTELVTPTRGYNALHKRNRYFRWRVSNFLTFYKFSKFSNIFHYSNTF